MPQTAKRGAGEAFGHDLSTSSRGLPKKKSKRERTQEQHQSQKTESPDVKNSNSAAATPRKPTGIGDTSEIAAGSQSTSPQIIDEEHLHRQSSENERQTANTEASLSKKKSRSRRNKKPRFDQTNSHIEIVLSRREDETHGHVEMEDQSSPRDRNENLSNSAEMSKHAMPVSIESRWEHKRELTSERKRKNKQKHKNPSSHKTKSSSAWTVSCPQGGAFIDHDPVLTPDEDFLILATKQDIQIYATRTSLLVRTLHITKRSEIVTFAQIPEQNQFIVIGLRDGTLLKFEWTTGEEVWSTSFNGSISSIVSTSSTAASDGFLMVNVSDDGSHNMTSLALDQHGKLLGRRHLLSQKNLLQHICFSAEMGILVVCSTDTIFIGYLGESDRENGADLEWQEITIVGKITCFDAEIKHGTQKHAPPGINVAVGLSSGEIQLYNDISSKTVSYKRHDLNSRRLHWHRSAPRTVKFSADSNYLISGGDETVLVIWQFLTNQKQTLPHLTTTILNATVSQQGSAYALRLGDNSVMVLSTSDLKPFANVSNLAVSTSSSLPFLPGHTIPAALHPQISSRLLLARSSQILNPTTRPSEKSANMLQTYDIASQLQLNSQALARNLAATVNIGPRGQALKEPDCTHLDITHDGKWLVTVDQWTPSDASVKEMYLSRGDQSSRQRLNECFLKFWSTSVKAEAGSIDVWELNTRIDEPISATEPAHGQQILDIRVNPSKLQVMVADSNRHLKIYSPKARIRSGVPVKDTNNQQLFTWTCDQDISLQEASALAAPKSAAVVYSEDGSVAVASWASTVNAKPRVHFIDSRTGQVVASIPDIVTSSRCSLAFCNQYLLALSDKFCVYDTVTMQQIFVIEIADKFDRGKSRMAVNTKSGIVAVTVSEREVKRPSQLMLLDVHALDRRPVLEEKVFPQIHVLLAEPDSGGFVVIDGESRTMKISPPGPVSVALIDRTVLPNQILAESKLHNLFGKDREEEATPLVRTVDSTQRNTLEHIFNSESNAAGAKDLFDRVAHALSGAVASIA